MILSIDNANGIKSAPFSMSLRETVGVSLFSDGGHDLSGDSGMLL